MRRTTTPRRVEKKKAPAPVKPSVNLDVEIGGSGLKYWSGTVDEEFLLELRGARGAKLYREMRSNSAIVGALLFAIRWLARSAGWDIHPHDDAPADDERVEFLRGALFDDMSFTWQDTLNDILTMLPFGWAYLEVVWKVRDGQQPIAGADPGLPVPASSLFTDRRIGWRKWALRGQDTLDRWQFDPSGGIHGMWQQLPTGAAPIFIPIDKALLFRLDIEKNNPEGTSLLRNAYRSWYFVKHLEQVEGIGIERDLAGYPYIKVLSDKDGPDVWNANDPEAVAMLARLKEMVRSIKRDEQEGAVLPDWCELTLLSGSSRRTLDTNAVITRHEQRIAMTVLADFIMIGHEQVGSKALFGGKAGLFALAMSGMLDTIAATINRYAIPKLLQLNGWSLDQQPTLTPGEIKDVDLQMVGEYLAKLSGAGAILFPNEALESHLLDLANLPSQLPEPAVRAAAIPQPEPAPEPAMGDDE